MQESYLIKATSKTEILEKKIYKMIRKKNPFFSYITLKYDISCSLCSDDLYRVFIS